MWNISFCWLCCTYRTWNWRTRQTKFTPSRREKVFYTYFFFDYQKNAGRHPVSLNPEMGSLVATAMNKRWYVWRCGYFLGGVVWGLKRWTNTLWLSSFLCQLTNMWLKVEVFLLVIGFQWSWCFKWTLVLLMFFHRRAYPLRAKSHSSCRYL